MSVLHDVYCPACEVEFRDQMIEPGDLPRCPVCHGEHLRVSWLHGHPPATDLFPTPQYSDASGQYHASQREKERHMQRLGCEPCGDKVHGGRVDLSLKDTSFFYQGQKSRLSSEERREARMKQLKARGQTPAP